MSKRLQVWLPDSEMEEIQKLAEREKVPVGEWVRRALRDVRSSKSGGDSQARLRAVRQVAEYSFPAADIAQMLAEIEQGYNG